MSFAAKAPDFVQARTELAASGCGYNDVRGREPAALGAPAAARIGVFLTLGQSQTANAGETLFAPHRGGRYDPNGGKARAASTMAVARVKS